MDKAKVLQALIDALKLEFKKSVGAARDAADYATDDESRAESQWDTQGLEASYLAAGQTEHARQLAEAIELLEASRSMLLSHKEEVAFGALITCDLNGVLEIFFMAPAGGGEVLDVDGKTVTVITPKSPIATKLLGKRAGEGFTLGNAHSACEVLEVA